MVQAACFDGAFFDAVSPFLDGRIAPEVDIGGRDVAEAFVIALVIVMLDESIDLVFQMSRQVIALQQDAVLQGLMPTLDFALGLRMVWRATDMVQTLILQPLGQIVGDKCFPSIRIGRGTRRVCTQSFAIVIINHIEGAKDATSH